MFAKDLGSFQALRNPPNPMSLILAGSYDRTSGTPPHHSLVYPLALRRIAQAALPYRSASAATSSRQKAGMSGTTRPQTE